MGDCSARRELCIFCISIAEHRSLVCNPEMNFKMRKVPVYNRDFFYTVDMLLIYTVHLRCYEINLYQMDS